MLDGILLEKAGLPTAVILTEPFRQSGLEMARHHGYGHLAFAAIPHPIATQSDATLREWAVAAAPDVVGILLGSRTQRK